jgi:hypothetical protein
MLLAKSTIGTKVPGAWPRMRSETGFFTRRGHQKPQLGIRQQHHRTGRIIRQANLRPCLFNRRQHHSLCQGGRKRPSAGQIISRRTGGLCNHRRNAPATAEDILWEYPSGYSAYSRPSCGLECLAGQPETVRQQGFLQLVEGLPAEAWNAKEFWLRHPGKLFVGGDPHIPQTNRGPK